MQPDITTNINIDNFQKKKNKMAGNQPEAKAYYGDTLYSRQLTKYRTTTNKIVDTTCAYVYIYLVLDIYMYIIQIDISVYMYIEYDMKYIQSI